MTETYNVKLCLCSIIRFVKYFYTFSFMYSLDLAYEKTCIFSYGFNDFLHVYGSYETHVSHGLYIFSGFNDLCLTTKLCAVVVMVTDLDFFIHFCFINSLDSDARDKDFKNTFIILSHVKICPAMMVTKKKKKELCRGSRFHQAKNM